MSQERVQKSRSGRGQTEQADSEQAPADVTNEELAESTDAVLDSIDDVLADQDDEDLLADIDDVLEENAEQFVNNYVQQGGE